MSAAAFGPRLTGKVAAISGIASGQGRAAAILFALHGASVVGCDLDDDGARATEAAANDVARDSSSGGCAVAVRADVSDEADVERWVETAADRFGRLDILYNNAARADYGTLADMDRARWRNAIEIELDGVWLPCRTAFAHLRRDPGEPWSSVINTASVSGMVSTLLPGLVGGMAHSTAKAGVIGLTRSLAEEYAGHGIRVNAISPGAVWTPALERSGRLTPEFDDAVMAKLLVKRRAQPEEIAACALFLASDESSYITGVNIPVDGGWTSV